MLPPVFAFSAPMAAAAPARSHSSLTICSSSPSIFVRQSAISIVLNLGCVLVSLHSTERRCFPGAQPSHKLAHGTSLVAGFTLLDQRNNRAAHDSSIGKLHDRPHMLRARDAETNRNRQVG